MTPLWTVLVLSSCLMIPMKIETSSNISVYQMLNTRCTYKMYSNKKEAAWNRTEQWEDVEQSGKGRKQSSWRMCKSFRCHCLRCDIKHWTWLMDVTFAQWGPHFQHHQVHMICTSLHQTWVPHRFIKFAAAPPRLSNISNYSPLQKE